MKMYFLVMKFIEWDDIGTDSPIMQWPITFSPVFGQGFLPVFKSKEEAEEAYPGEQILALELKPTEAANVD